MIARTISGAAELLNVSQPGVSRALKHIESKLALELFERRPNGMIPTPEAERLFNELQPIYNRLDDLGNNMNRILRSDDPTLQIGCAPSLSHFLLPMLLARAKKKMPNIVARVDTLSNEELSDYIIKQSGDFALSTYDPDHPLIFAEPSFMGQIQCVLPRDHELAEKKAVSFEEIAAFDLVTYYNDSFVGRMVNNRFAELGLEPKVSVKVRFNDDACAMVAHGLGVGFALNYCTIEGLPENLTVRPLTDKLKPVRVYLLRHNGASFSDKVRRFYDNMIADMDAFGLELNEQNGE